MGSAPAVVHLVGRPGSGKRTVALALVEAAAAEGRTFELVDNHRTGNLILSLIGVDGRSEVPSAAWDRVIEVREAVFRTIEELSPPDWSFVLTNVLLADDPRDHAAVARLRAMAAVRGSTYLPVHVQCEDEELLRRVPSPERIGLLEDREDRRADLPEGWGRLGFASQFLDLGTVACLARAHH